MLMTCYRRVSCVEYITLTFLFLLFTAGDLSCYNYMKKNSGTLCCLLVDSGYSFTHIVPYIKGKKLKQGIRRIDVGGKMLTNHLKEIISYRYSELSPIELC